MRIVHVRPQEELAAAAERAFARHRRRVVELLPGAEVEHVGATSIPGALTKGDVDLLVRVPATEFGAAVGVLRRAYGEHQRPNWTAAYASFVAVGEEDPPVGVQLVVAGSAEDGWFEPFRRALLADPALLAAYNELKRRLDGAEYDAYTAAKGEFVEAVLAHRAGTLGP